jgi:lysyl-tRNA synthetase class 2
MIPFGPSASLDALRARAKLLRQLRSFFDSRDFIEVQTPLLSRFAVVDTHLEPIAVHCSGESSSRYLQTSPELNMKRLLAAGLTQIYQVGSVFRDSEFGPMHNPEFTMAEWYRVGDTFEDGIQLLNDLVHHVLQCGPASRIRFGEAFQLLMQIDPFETSLSELARIAVHRKLVDSPEWSSDRDDWTDLLFSHCVQPMLGQSGPEIVTHFPASRAALARLCQDDPRTAERFELFIGGVELANGYHELLDSDVLRERDERSNAERLAAGKVALPVNEPLLAAMDSGLPNCSGCALGFDRLAMIALGKPALGEVLCFAWDRA